MSARGEPKGEELTELVRTLLIATLGIAGIPQKNIRAIARCDMHRVGAVLKHLKIKSKQKRA
jgi:hypothetical protein